ncbi:transmembrane protein 177-like [Eriocheir sinensis]|uniref:transmembrane protein 177-like n=1 Tax=Eriocheir sinensis TaxID=95602 RepID=UPI0021C8C852|nr:transmembrane protein 177-like [Eriocheir sinensis]
MAARKGLPWTVSAGGLRVLRGTVGALVGGTFLVHYLPHTWLIDKTQQFTQAYRKGQAIPVPKTVTELVEEVMGEMGMGEEARGRVRVYTSFGYDFYHAGSSGSTHGAILGVPKSARWESLADFDPTGVVVNNEPVAWSTAGGQRLMHSLVLSKNAKKFAIARELHGIETDPILTRAFIPSLGLTTSYTLALGINRRLNLYARPRSLRVVLYGLTSLIGYVVFILGTDMMTVSSEAKGDGAAAAMGKGYAEGGVEFYQKVLGRNVALRELMGSDGEKLFTAMGNDELLVRTRHLPYTMRLDSMKKHLKKYEKEEEEGKEGEGKGSDGKEELKDGEGKEKDGEKKEEKGKEVEAAKDDDGKEGEVKGS